MVIYIKLNSDRVTKKQLTIGIFSNCKIAIIANEL